MARIQLSWRDRSLNETYFAVYRGTSSALTVTDDLIFKLEPDAQGNYEITYTMSNYITNAVLLDTASSEAGISEGYLRIAFDDSFVGDVYYGIAAGNNAGESDIVPISNKITI